jgi:hypothetical protein
LSFSFKIVGFPLIITEIFLSDNSSSSDNEFSKLSCRLSKISVLIGMERFPLKIKIDLKQNKKQIRKIKLKLIVK